MNPHQPYKILFTVGILSPSLYYFAEILLIVDMKDVKYMLKCLTQFSSVSPVLQKVQSIISFSS